MPEGHTIHGLARDLGAALEGRIVSATSPQGRFGDGARRLDGHPPERFEAWGKHLFGHWPGGDVLHIHLGLIGKFRPVDPSSTPADTIRLRLSPRLPAAQNTLPAAPAPVDRAWDLSGPMTCRVIDPAEVDAVTASLGPDPLRPRTRPDRFFDALDRRSKPIGATLLDQSVIAGLGNVYRAEILFLCGIHPDRPSNALTDDERACVWDHAKSLLRRGLKVDRIVTLSPDDTSRRDRTLARLPGEDRVYVYKRDTCRRCGSALQPLEVGGRAMHACPSCQR